MDQFRTITIEVDAGGDERSYRVQFVTSGEECYVSGRIIAADHLESGIGGLPVRVVGCNAKGDREVTRLYSFAPLDAASEDRSVAQELFVRKYGHDHHEVILKLVEAPGE